MLQKCETGEIDANLEDMIKNNKIKPTSVNMKRRYKSAVPRQKRIHQRKMMIEEEPEPPQFLQELAQPKLDSKSNVDTTRLGSQTEIQTLYNQTKPMNKDYLEVLRANLNQTTQGPVRTTHEITLDQDRGLTNEDYQDTSQLKMEPLGFQNVDLSGYQEPNQQLGQMFNQSINDTFRINTPNNTFELESQLRALQ